MTAVAPQTHLKPTNSEGVNHPETPFLPDTGTSLPGDGHFQFSNGPRTILIHVVLQERRLQVRRRRKGGTGSSQQTKAEVQFRPAPDTSVVPPPIPLMGTELKHWIVTSRRVVSGDRYWRGPRSQRVGEEGDYT